MRLSGRLADDRRTANARSLAAFGVRDCGELTGTRSQSVREGKGQPVLTVGYERRSGTELIDLLLGAGVAVLVDVREKAISRKPDFRANALLRLCQGVGIEYIQMPELGSSASDREELRETGDIHAFLCRFRVHAKTHLDVPLSRLAGIAQKRRVALLCYERSHDDCHRSVIADMLADRLNAGITAIV